MRRHLFHIKLSFAGLGLATCFLLSACGGSGNASPQPPSAPSTFLLGGTVTGLGPAATLNLVNGADSLTVSANGAFSFPTKLAAGIAYNVTVVTAPGRACVVTDGAATMGSADVTKIAVKCAPFLLAGLEAAVHAPAGVAVDKNGNAFAIDPVNQLIVKLSKAGVASTLAGAKGVHGSQDGTGTAASFHFSSLSRMLADEDGNLIVTDTCNALLRKVTPGGVVTTIAGTLAHLCNNYVEQDSRVPVDGVGKAAVFAEPMQIALDKNGDYLVYDFPYELVRRVTPAGVVTTQSWVTDPAGGINVSTIAIDKSGTLYVAGVSQADHRPHVWKIVDGKAMSFVGGATTPGMETASVDGLGAAAGFANIGAMVADGAGLYLSDRFSIRRITPEGSVTTIAGGDTSGAADGIGKAVRFGLISGMALDPDGNAVLGESDQNTMRVVTPAGVTSTLAATPRVRDYVDATGAAARFDNAGQPGVDPDGNVYVADSIQHVVRKISPGGEVSLFAGIPGSKGGANGPAGVATFSSPRALAVDRNGTVYVSDLNGIRKIAGGMVTLMADMRGASSIVSLAIDADGNLAAADTGTVYLISAAGARTEIDSGKAIAALNLGSRFAYFIPQGIVYDAAGNLYISDTGNIVVYKYSKAGVMSLFAGTPTVEGDADGPVGTATFGFYTVEWLTIDGGGNLYLSGQGKLRKISPAGLVSTPALAWGNPNLLGLAFGKGMLYGTTRYAVLQLRLE